MESKAIFLFFHHVSFRSVLRSVLSLWQLMTHVICVSQVNTGRQWQNKEWGSLCWSCPDSWVPLPDQSVEPLKLKTNIKNRRKKYFLIITSAIKQPLRNFSGLFSSGWSTAKCSRGCCVKAFRSLVRFLRVLPVHSFGWLVFSIRSPVNWCPNWKKWQLQWMGSTDRLNTSRITSTSMV